MKRSEANIKLTRAINHGDLAAASDAIKEGAEVNIPGDLYYDPPLYNAADRHQYDMCKLLIDSGADVNIKDKIGVSVIEHLAIIGGEKEALLLIASGAAFDAPNRHGDTPLIRAIIDGQPQMAKLFLAAGANPNVKNSENSTPLHYAVRQGDVDTFKKLIDLGADIEAKNNKGITPMQVFEQYPKFTSYPVFLQMKQYVLEHNAAMKILAEANKSTAEKNDFEWEY